MALTPLINSIFQKPTFDTSIENFDFSGRMQSDGIHSVGTADDDPRLGVGAEVFEGTSDVPVKFFQVGQFHTLVVGRVGDDET